LSTSVAVEDVTNWNVYVYVVRGVEPDVATLPDLLISILVGALPAAD
jgi:hypothetical protein